jgi:DNA repair protein RadD
MKLRPYQNVGIDSIRSEMRRGNSRVLFVLPTGGGKTVVASHIIQSAIAKGTKCLFVAHRQELIYQSYAKLLGCTCSRSYSHEGLFGRDPTCKADGLPERDVGIIMADDPRRRPGARVWVCSIQSLRTRKLPADIGLIIIDEAHRCLAPSYRALMDQFPNANIIGLTATPYRADGKGMGAAGYTALVKCSSVRELIGLGALVEPRVFTVPPEELPDLSQLKVRGGDYAMEELNAAVNQKKLVGSIVEHWLEKAQGRRTVCFASSVEHSKEIVARFLEAGIRAEHLDGTTPDDERASILRRIETGETQVVCNYGVLTEGWDQPSVKCCILARPTKSKGLYFQMAGRILRPFESLEALILDHAGCARDHGLPQDDQEFSLESSVRKKKNDNELSVRTCPQCYACLPPATKQCFSCGYTFAETPREPLEEEEGELVEMKPATMEEKRAFWEHVCAMADENGFKPGWATYRYKERFGGWPPSSWPKPGEPRQPKTDAPLEERVAKIVELRIEARAKNYNPNWVGHRYKAIFGCWPEGLVLRAANAAEGRIAS